jgi:toxin ParE1/3/4
MARVYQRASARRELIQHFVHLAEAAGNETADRFLANARASFTRRETGGVSLSLGLRPIDKDPQLTKNL